MLAKETLSSNPTNSNDEEKWRRTT
jgi:hypothetical protein